MTKKPFAMQWHITNKCDQRCKHCYIYEGKEKEVCLELNLEVLIKILENFINSCERLNVYPTIALTGGDPLLYKDFWGLLEAIKHYNISFSILGNPFHLNYDVIRDLEKYGCTSYQMSLDGLEDTHDSIRKQGSYQNTLEALKYFDNSTISTAIMTTVSKTNIKELPRLVDVVVEHKVDRFGFARYCPNPEDIDLIVSPEEYHDLLEKMWQKFDEFSQSSTQFIFNA